MNRMPRLSAGWERNFNYFARLWNQVMDVIQDGFDTVTQELAGYVQTPPAWTAYAPTVSAGSGSFTSASATGRYQQIGKLVFLSATITITTNGTAAGSVNLTLPVASKSAVVITGVESVGNKATKTKTSAGSSSAVTTLYDNTYPGANGSTIVFGGCYEAN